ncbi:hypothetical protein GCM10022215_22960 [Nocardioides fonticola]|uniref:DUF6318 domain-containing protein n=1 Tax=Nocardioides fonticola TaxID=450363 RepID=A0ABP7XK68_9ACTN
MPTRAPALPGLLLALTLTALAGLTGCGGDSDASADPPAPAPTSTTPTVDPTPTTPPTQAPLGETAREFIERWFALEKYAQNTGDTGPYRAVSKGCESCASTAGAIDRFYNAGGYVKGGGASVESLKRVSSVPGTAVYVVDVSYEATDFKKSATSKPDHLDGGPVRFKLTLEHGRAWNLSEFTQLVEE